MLCGPEGSFESEFLSASVWASGLPWHRTLMKPAHQVVLPPRMDHLSPGDNWNQLGRSKVEQLHLVC